MLQSSLATIKQELKHASQDELMNICIRLMKYKKENKELVDYILFEEKNTNFISDVRLEISKQFEQVNTSSMYLAKKTIRKSLRTCQKYIKYAASNNITIEILIHFCQQMNQMKLNYKESVAMMNLYHSQLNHINKSLLELHEDLQFDYRDRIEALMQAGRN